MRTILKQVSYILIGLNLAVFSRLPGALLTAQEAADSGNLNSDVAGQRDPESSNSSSAKTTTSKAVTVPDADRVSLVVARDRAQLMQDIYSATLDSMHHRYFHGDRAVVPARAMEDVFKTIERRNHSQSRWISASFRAMNIDHEPQTDFEKLAAKKIARGTPIVETVEDGYYRRACSIPFTAGCVNCHSGLFSGTSPSRRFAGLVISIPIDNSVELQSVTADVAPTP